MSSNSCQSQNKNYNKKDIERLIMKRTDYIMLVGKNVFNFAGSIPRTNILVFIKRCLQHGIGRMTVDTIPGCIFFTENIVRNQQ